MENPLIPKCLETKPVICLPFWDYYRFRYEYGKVKIADQSLTLPISKTIEVLRKNEHPAAVYKYVYSGFKSATTNEVQALLDSGNIQTLRSKMLQNAQKQVDLLKEHLVNVVSKEEIVVEYWDNDKKDKKDKDKKDDDKPSRTNNIISDNRIIQKGIT